jgi:hypothetical protein
MAGSSGAAGGDAPDASRDPRERGDDVDRAEGDASGGRPRQRVERVRGSRRARLTPAPGSDPSPEAPAQREAPTGTTTPDDERITRERPPHW